MDAYDFKIIGGSSNPFPGYNSASDKTDVKAGTLIRGSKNVQKKISGTIANRCGLKRRGSVDATDAGVKASFDFVTREGINRPLRVANGKLQVEADIVTSGTPVWYELFDTSAIGSIVTVSINSGGSGYASSDVGTIVDIIGGSGISGMVRIIEVTSGAITGISLVDPGTGYAVATNVACVGTLTVDITEVSTVSSQSLASSLTRFIFDTWWDEDSQKNRAIMVRGDDKIFSWSGGMAVLSSTTATTITKTGTESWEEAGFAVQGGIRQSKINIGGNIYYYTGGETTTTLTGVTPSPASEVAGAIAIQAIIASPSTPFVDAENDFIKTVNNQVLVGSYNSRTISISADTDFEDFVNAGAYVTGDPDKIILDNLAKGIGVRAGKPVIFAGNSEMYLVELNFNVPVSFTGGDGSTRFILQKVDKVDLPSNSASLAHEFISNIGDDLIWLDQNHQLRSLGNFTNTSSIKPSTLSLPVRNELREEDFTGGHIRVIDETIHITAPVSGRDWMYEVRDTVNATGEIVSERLWQPPQIRGISRFAVIDGVKYGYSNANPQIYEIEETGQWFDDSPSETELPYACVARFAYQSHGKPQGMITFDKVYYEGYMVPGTPLYENLLIDYQGATQIIQNTISDADNIPYTWIGTVAPSLGDASLGDNPLGVGILEESDDQETLSKFRKITEPNRLKNCFEYSIEVDSYDIDARWELLRLGANARLAEEAPNFLLKTL